MDPTHDLPFISVVKHIAGKAAVQAPNGCWSYDDYFQEGAIAVIEALDTYDPEKGPLAAWVVPRIGWRIIDLQRRSNGGTWRNDRADNPTRPLCGDAPISPDSGTTFFDALSDPAPLVDDVVSARVDDLNQLRRCAKRIASTDSRRTLVFILRVFYGMTLNEIGSRLGFGESRACQLYGDVTRSMKAAA